VNKPVRCPQCGGVAVKCPECGDTYELDLERLRALDTRGKCPRKECAKMGAPLDCTRCGLTVEAGLRGVLSLDGDLLPWKEDDSCVT